MATLRLTLQFLAPFHAGPFGGFSAPFGLKARLGGVGAQGDRHGFEPFGSALDVDRARAQVLHLAVCHCSQRGPRPGRCR